MDHEMHGHGAHDPDRAPWWRSRGGLVLLGFLAIAGYFLLTEHRAHVLGALPWLLLLSCPLMHLFMHHGHGGLHHGPRRADDQAPTTPASTTIDRERLP